jgi:hypothetical protein
LVFALLSMKIAILLKKRDFSAQAGSLPPFWSQPVSVIVPTRNEIGRARHSVRADGMTRTHLLATDGEQRTARPAKTSSGLRQWRPLFYPEAGPGMDFTSDLRSAVSSG